ncbi:MAM and LDL-receptor class A domain-containing protein 1-like [Stegodyphus dumicola]|uniref:MAM and LDL-receptor class A domain-containing protein 1-like n=1 Tax=Stegodyphus dumicola TaxID=202533 RepID=UPI0015A86DE2|nr:MAM and LDL-receptor class A domain-containing protein 1-like [Stegodyphus dumicola]
MVFVNHTDNKIYNEVNIFGNQDDNWYQVKKLVKDLPPIYKIRYIGVRERTSEIALDEILIQPDSCTDPTIPTSPPTDFPLSAWDCDFGDFCGWINSGAWVVQDGRKALISKLGPALDHTRKDALGRYAYYKPLNDSGHDLISVEMDTSEQEYCFQFWYYIHSSSPITLEVHAIQNNQITGPLWVQKANADERWKYGTFFVENSGCMSIVLRPTRSKPHVGDIAIDDILLKPGCSRKLKHIAGWEIGVIVGIILLVILLASLYIWHKKKINSALKPQQ